MILYIDINMLLLLILEYRLGLYLVLNSTNILLHEGIEYG